MGAEGCSELGCKIMRMRRIVFVLMLLFDGNQGFSQVSLRYPLYDYQALLGVSGVAVLDTRLLFYQPAVVFSEPGLRLAAAHLERFPELELSHQQLAGVYSTKKTDWGITAQSQGNDALRRSQISLVHGRALSQTFRIGIMLGYQTARTKEYGGNASPVYQLGWSWRYSPRLHFSGVVENLYLPAGREKPAMVLRNSITACPSKEFSVCLWLLTDEGRSGRLLAGMRYAPSEKVWGRVGWLTNESLLVSVAGYRSGRWMFETGTQYHLLLGFSPQLIIHYNPLRHE